MIVTVLFSKAMTPTNAIIIAFLVIGVGSLKADSATKEASKLIAGDVSSGGKSTPKGPTPMALRKGPEKRSYDEGDPEILILPKVQVTAPKISAFERRLEELEKERSRESKSTTPSGLDLFLNGSRFSLGGSSAYSRAAQAQKRIDIMDWERLLLISLLAAKTPEEEEQIRLEMRMLRGLRR